MNKADQLTVDEFLGEAELAGIRARLAQSYRRYYQGLAIFCAAPILATAGLWLYAILLH